jgi:hypothetical protein
MRLRYKSLLYLLRRQEVIVECIPRAQQRLTNKPALLHRGLAVACGLVIALCVSVAAADDGQEHRLDQSANGEILLGTSGSNINSRSGSLCCTGTLGAMVVNRTGRRFILSNNHILARTNQAWPGEAIIHPGLVDQDPVCTADRGDRVANFASFVPISFEPGAVNDVDAAIAAVRDPTISAAILDIGTVGSEILQATPNLQVQKSGRTSGLTFGRVAAVDVSVDVGFRKTCGSPTILVARFVGQVRIIGDSGLFTAGGDSGALVVEVREDGLPPRAVGLHFAGGGGSSFANPIGRVLGCLGVGLPGGNGHVNRDLNCIPIGDGNSESSHTHGRGPSGQGPPGPSTNLPFGLALASMVRADYEVELFAHRGVVGTGIGVDEQGEPVIEVYLREVVGDPDHIIPSELEGIPVRTLVTGRIMAE